jgi:hypothetical protein
MLPRKYSPQEQLGFGIHFAKSKNFAQLYGNIIYHCKLYPLHVLDLTKPHKKGTKEHRLLLELHKGTGRRPMYWDDNFWLNPDMTSPKRAEHLIWKYGYDAARYEAKYGSHTLVGGMAGMKVAHSTDAVVMLDPTKIQIIKVETVNYHPLKWVASRVGLWNL